jgi:hypothetical protein
MILTLLQWSGGILLFSAVWVAALQFGGHPLD